MKGPQRKKDEALFQDLRDKNNNKKNKMKIKVAADGARSGEWTGWFVDEPNSLQSELLKQVYPTVMKELPKMEEPQENCSQKLHGDGNCKISTLIIQFCLFYSHELKKDLQPQILCFIPFSLPVAPNPPL